MSIIPSEELTVQLASWASSEQAVPTQLTIQNACCHSGFVLNVEKEVFTNVVSDLSLCSTGEVV